MKILFFTSSEQDYLSDGLLLGLRHLYGASVVDYPRRDILYRDCPDFIRRQVRGQGFTLYTGILEEIPVDRYGVGEKLICGEYDLVVISDVWRQFGFFTQWSPYLTPENTILVDGSDTAQVYPHAGYWWRRPGFWFLPRAETGYLYFKRELTPDSRFGLMHRLLPRRCRGWFPHYRGLRKTSFGIPSEKIVGTAARKTKDFPCHIVDPEVAGLVPGSSSDYAFNSEVDYYADLQASRFGITTRRAGWDCLRHYEIAANGAVPCFRDLDVKPADCAPHGLVPGSNCLSYRNAFDLMGQIGALSEIRYEKLRESALAWSRGSTCVEVAGAVIREWKNHRETSGESARPELPHAASPADGFRTGSSRIS